MNELEKAYKEYIDFLEKEISSSAVYLHTHGWIVPDEIILKGEELREKIKDLTPKNT